MKPIVYIRAGHSGVHPVTGQYLTKQESNSKYFLHNNGKPYHRSGYFYEGVSNRNVADEFTKIATEFGLHVIPVHHPYLDFSLGAFCQIANGIDKIFSTAESPSIFLDIHSNAGKARGFTTFYFPGHVDSNGNAIRRPSFKGMALAQHVAQFVNPYWLQHESDYKTAVREGWLYRGGKIIAPYYMLANTNMPSIIVENGFFDNEHDADLLMQPKFIEGLAEQMVNGCLSYFKNL
jgi:hypothetical protein